MPASFLRQSPATCACGTTSTSSRSLGGVEAGVELLEARRLLDRHARAAGRAEEDVVMAAEIARRGPLVAEEGDGAALLGGRARQLVEQLPLRVVHPHVVLGERQEVEPRVLDAVAEVLLGGALTLGQAGVAVGLAPEHASGRALRRQHRVAGGAPLAVGRAHRRTDGRRAGRSRARRRVGARDRRPRPSSPPCRRAPPPTRVGTRSPG